MDNLTDISSRVTHKHEKDLEQEILTAIYGYCYVVSYAQVIGVLEMIKCQIERDARDAMEDD